MIPIESNQIKPIDLARRPLAANLISGPDEDDSGRERRPGRADCAMTAGQRVQLIALDASLVGAPKCAPFQAPHSDAKQTLAGWI